MERHIREFSSESEFKKEKDTLLSKPWLALIDDKSLTPSQFIIHRSSDIEYPSSLIVTIGGEGWSSVCFPFNIKLTEGLKAKYLTSADWSTGELKFSDVDTNSIIKKGTGIFLVGEPGKTYELHEDLSTEKPVILDGSIMQGTIIDLQVEPKTTFVLKKDSREISLYTGTLIPKYKAFIYTKDVKNYKE